MCFERDGLPPVQTVPGPTGAPACLAGGLEPRPAALGASGRVGGGLEANKRGGLLALGRNGLSPVQTVPGPAGAHACLAGGLEPRPAALGASGRVGGGLEARETVVYSRLVQAASRPTRRSPGSAGASCLPYGRPGAPAGRSGERPAGRWGALRPGLFSKVLLAQSGSYVALRPATHHPVWVKGSCLGAPAPSCTQNLDHFKRIFVDSGWVCRSLPLFRRGFGFSSPSERLGPVF